MSVGTVHDLAEIRGAIADFQISPSVQPNETIDIERVFYPSSHRGVLDLKRQLVVGNRGMGKSFWSHALINPDVRERVSKAYAFPILAKTKVVLGFNGSVKLSTVTPNIDEIRMLYQLGNAPETIWRAVIVRALRSLRPGPTPLGLPETLDGLRHRPEEYAEELSAMDDASLDAGGFVLIVFDALDRLSHDWKTIRDLTRGLLVTVLGLQSFRSIRAKIFMRADQFADTELFRFPDSSKLRNDYVDLGWQPYELYGLLFFEVQRRQNAATALEFLASKLDARSALPEAGHQTAVPDKQQALVNAIAGEFMGSDRKRGRVYTWVPLHLSDAANNCSPRTFLTAWKTAAEHVPAPAMHAVDHLGLSEGVRKASHARLTELNEDYPWIRTVLAPLRRQFVPLEKAILFSLWSDSDVVGDVLQDSESNSWLPPIGVGSDKNLDVLLRTMVSIGVMEQRANGKINVPDIFRVEAEILRRGGVSVPRKK